MAKKTTKKKSKTKKIKAGQPTKYKPEYCQMLIETMSDGSSLTAFCANIGIPKQTAYNWMGKNKDFFDAHKKAVEICKAWWEDLLKKTADGKKKGNLGAQVFWMKNRFRDDWRDKIEYSWDDDKDELEEEDDELIDIAKS